MKLLAKEKSERELEQFLFNDIDAPATLGDGSIEDVRKSPDDYLAVAEISVDDLHALPDDQLFVMDSDIVVSTTTTTATEDLPAGAEEREASASDKNTPPAVWFDEDDERIKVDISKRNISRKLRKTKDESVVSGKYYEQKLRNQFDRIYAKPSWAEVSPEQIVDESSIFKSAGGLLSKTRSSAVSPDHLNISRVRDANYQEFNQSIVSSISWHPNAQVLLTAGLDKTLRIFQIDGEHNPKLQSMHINNLPIHQAQFTPNGREIIISGRRKFFHVFDIERGRIIKVPGISGRREKSLEQFCVNEQYLSFFGMDGEIVVLSAKSKQWINTLKINGTLKALEYSEDGNFIYATGGDGEIYQFDLRMQKCIHRFTDEGAFKNTALAVCRNNRYLASGSESGVVNLYDADQCQPGMTSTPRPIKSIMNLTTYVDHIRFNHDSQLLGICSRVKKDQFKMVHLPSGRVFANWPTAQTPLSRVQCFEFSPNSNYVAIGNDKGRVLLYRLNDYTL